MERFKGLNACLRKPCPWLDTCRNLHLPFGKFELNEGLKKKCKFTPFSRVCKVFNGANNQPGPGAKAVKNVASLKGEPHKTVRGQKEEIAHTSLKRGLPQEEDKEAKIS